MLFVYFVLTVVLGSLGIHADNNVDKRAVAGTCLCFAGYEENGKLVKIMSTDDTYPISQCDVNECHARCHQKIEELGGVNILSFFHEGKGMTVGQLFCTELAKQGITDVLNKTIFGYSSTCGGEVENNEKEVDGFCCKAGNNVQC